MLGPDVSAQSNQLLRLDTNRPVEGSRVILFGLDRVELASRLAAIGEPAWRERQLAEAMYRQRLATLDELTTLPKALRRRLTKEGWSIGRPRIAQTVVSNDGTERYLVECLAFGSQTVEAVWMPDGDGGETGDGSDGEMPENNVGGSSCAAAEGRPEAGWDRATICVSSQMGCAVNCQFCLTAKLGLQRNLTAGEIAGQVVAVLDRHKVEIGKDRVNLVFMGMGEPLLNYEHWRSAVRLLVEEVGISPQRMTVSTSGIVPGIERFAEEPPELRPKLAISLNAPNDDVRDELMPINRKWPIEAVLDAVRKVQLRSRERITFEYVLLGGLTDKPEHAQQVARLIRRSGLAAKVNLIGWNPGPGIPYTMPETESIERFRKILSEEGVRVYVRRPRGRDIYAACGQLKRTVEPSGSPNPSTHSTPDAR
jgi:23S rRNA (adenine2503-C2)-methyltransferase